MKFKTYQVYDGLELRDAIIKIYPDVDLYDLFHDLSNGSLKYFHIGENLSYENSSELIPWSEEEGKYKVAKALRQLGFLEDEIRIEIWW